MADQEKIVDPENEQIKFKLMGFGSFFAGLIFMGAIGAGQYSPLGALFISTAVMIIAVYRKGKKQ